MTFLKTSIIYFWQLLIIYEYHHSGPTNETRCKCDLPNNYSQNTVINDSIPTEEQNEVVLDLLWDLKQLSSDEYA